MAGHRHAIRGLCSAPRPVQVQVRSVRPAPGQVLTFTKAAKNKSELSSCTRLEAVFLSLQWDACLWTSSASRLGWGLHPVEGTRDLQLYQKPLHSYNSVPTPKHFNRNTKCKNASVWLLLNVQFYRTYMFVCVSVCACAPQSYSTINNPLLGSPKLKKNVTLLRHKPRTPQASHPAPRPTGDAQ